MQYTTLLALGLAASACAHSVPWKRQSDDSGDVSDLGGIDNGDDGTDAGSPCDPNDENCQFAESTYLEGVCYPRNSTEDPDLSTPCWQSYALTFECSYGAPGLAAAWTDMDGEGYGVPDNATMLNNSTQRDCICQSQYFAAIEGCSDCYSKHGASDTDGSGNVVVPSLLTSLSSSYCAVTNTPTAAFADVIYALATEVSTVSQTSTFSDPVGNSTAVSLYYTPSVTGSAAWVVAQATETPSSGTGTGTASSSTSVHTSNGQIVPTSAGASSSSAASSKATSSATGSSGSSATSTSSGGGSQQTAAVAGVIALAGIVALL